VLFACAVVAVLPVVAVAQEPRAWAGATEPAREPLRIAAAPPASAPDSAAPAAEPAGLIPTGNLLATIRDGGILMIPLIGCSFALAVFGIERAVNLRTGNVVPKLFVDRFVAQLRAHALARQAALEACDENGSPAARVFAAAIRRWGRPAVEIEQAAIDACERELNHLRRYRRVFNGVATIGPMLGLLGTTLGMITTFHEISGKGAGGSNQLGLAQGVSEALLCTASGLVIGIPALMFYAIFRGKVNRLISEMEAATTHLMALLAVQYKRAARAAASV
jgi:biopolymer transport protein ExbB